MNDVRRVLREHHSIQVFNLEDGEQRYCSIIYELFPAESMQCGILGPSWVPIRLLSTTENIVIVTFFNGEETTLCDILPSRSS